MSLEALVKDVLLLHRLSLFPEQPHDNCLDEKALPFDSRRKLKLPHELGIANAFSFLTAYSDDKSKVAAICVEEVADCEDRLMIRVASNDGKVETVQAGLEDLASILTAQAAQATRSEELADRLIRQIVSFNRMRILRRLRSSQAPQRGRVKPSIVIGLVAALKETKLRIEVPEERLDVLESKTSELARMFAVLENMDRVAAQSDESTEILLTVIQTISAMISQHQLLETLELIHPKSCHFSGGRKLHLVEALQKLGQYCAWTDYLLSMSHSVKCFGHIVVLPVLPMNFSIPSNINASTEARQAGLLEELLQGQQSSDLARIGQLERRLQLNIPNMQILVEKQAQSEHKLHAEMQLLFFYEQQLPNIIKPRVMSASKSACFLCNQFLNLHGGFYIPKTHGRLYPQWILPDLACLNVSDSRRHEFSRIYTELHQIVRKSIFVVLETSPDIPAYENESRVNLVPSLTASELSLTLAQTENEVDNLRTTPWSVCLRLSLHLLSWFSRPVSSNQKAKSGT